MPSDINKQGVHKLVNIPLLINKPPVFITVIKALLVKISIQLFLQTSYKNDNSPDPKKKLTVIVHWSCQNDADAVQTVSSYQTALLA